MATIASLRINLSMQTAQMEAGCKSAGNSLRQLQGMMKEGVAVTAELMTASERYAAENARLTQLFWNGAISVETYTRGVDKLREAMDKPAKGDSFKEWAKSLTVAGVAMYAFKSIASSAESAASVSASGGGRMAQYDAFMRSLPVIGEGMRAGSALREMVWGEEAKAARESDEAQKKLNKDTEAYANLWQSILALKRAGKEDDRAVEMSGLNQFDRRRLEAEFRYSDLEEQARLARAALPAGTSDTVRDRLNEVLGDRLRKARELLDDQLSDIDRDERQRKLQIAHEPVAAKQAEALRLREAEADYMDKITIKSEEYIEKLQAEADAIGKNASQVELHRHKLELVATGHWNEAKALTAKREHLEAYQKQLDKGIEIFNETRTAAERVAEKYDILNKLRNNLPGGEDTFLRAQRQLAIEGWNSIHKGGLFTDTSRSGMVSNAALSGNNLQPSLNTMIAHLKTIAANTGKDGGLGTN